MSRRKMFARRVLSIEYEHVDDPRGTVRDHTFGPGVKMFAVEDGTIELEHRDPSIPLWEDFPDATPGE